MSDNIRIFKNFLSLFSIRGVNLLIPVITLPYIIQKVGFENYGHIALALASATFFGTISQYGFAITGVRDVSRSKKNPERLSEVFWANFLASILIATLVCSIYIGLVFYVEGMGKEKYVYISGILLVVFNAILPHWYFLGIEKSHFVALSTFISKSLYLAMLVFFVSGPQDYIYVNAIGAVCAAVNLAISITYILFFSNLLWRYVPLSKIILNLREGFPSFIIQWSPNLYNSFTILILGSSVSTSSIGVFNAANTVINLIISVARLVSNAFLPLLGVDKSKHNQSTIVLLIFGVAATALVFILSNYISLLFGDVDKVEFVQSLQYLAIGIPFVCGYFAYGLNYIALSETGRSIMYMPVIVAIVGLLCAALIVPPLGLIGACIVLFLTRIGLFIGSYAIYLRRQ